MTGFLQSLRIFLSKYFWSSQHRLLIPWQIAVALTLIGLPFILWLNHTWYPALATYREYDVACIVAFLTWIWWIRTDTGSFKDWLQREAYLFYFSGFVNALCAVAGMMCLSLCYHYLFQQLSMSDLMLNHKLSFMVSVIIFAITYYTRNHGRKEHDIRVFQLRITQYIVLGMGLILTGYAHLQPGEVPYANLLSWAIFFIISDWYNLERYAISTGEPLGSVNTIKLITFNAIIFTAAYHVAFQLPHLAGSSFWIQTGFVLSISCCWIGLSVLYLLFPFDTSPQESLESLERRSGVKIPAPEELLPAHQQYVVLLVQGHRTSGTPFWAYVAIEMEKLHEFKQAEARGHYKLNEYGIVITQGDGEQPATEIEQLMQLQYGLQPKYHQSLWGKIYWWLKLART